MVCASGGGWLLKNEMQHDTLLDCILSRCQEFFHGLFNPYKESMA